MKIHSLALITLLALANALSACSPEKPSPKTQKEPSSRPKPTMDIDKTDKAFIGLTTEEGEKLAKGRKLLFRVINIDGVQQFGTKDYRPERVNATIVTGKITGTSRG